jgi:hypothetical protein
MDSVSRQYPQRNLHGRIVHTLGRRILRGEINPGDALDAGSVMAASRTSQAFRAPRSTRCPRRWQLPTIEASTPLSRG